MLKKILYSSIITLLSFLLFATPLSMRDFFTRGEAREAIEVPAMFKQDNFILPLRNGGDMPSKPPMYHWLSGTSSTLLGSVDEFSIRLPSAFLSALFLGAFFFFVFQISNLRRASISTLILASSAEWLRSASHARVDIAFAFWLSLACIGFYQAIEQQKSKKSFIYLWYLLAALATAGAILSKGPAAFLLIGTISTLHILLDPTKRGLKNKFLTFPYLHCLFAASLSLIIAGSWYYLAYELHGKTFLNKQIFQENVARIVHSEGENPGHEKPFYFSVLLLIQGFLPWSLFFPVLVLFFVKKGRSVFQIEDNFFRFSSIWAGVFLLAVTASLSKRSVYLLPAYPALSYMLAFTIQDQLAVKVHWLEKLSKNLFCTFRIVLMIACSICIFLVFVDLKLLPFNLNKKVEMTAQLLQFNYYFAGLIGLSLALALIQKKHLKAFEREKFTYNLGLCLLSLSLAINGFVLPAISKVSSPKKFASTVRDFVSADQKIYQYSDEFYALVFYLEKPLYRIQEVKQLAIQKVSYIVIKEKEYKGLNQIKEDFQILAKSKELAGNGKDYLLLLKRKS